MAATGFTPIQLYRTSTASAVPSAGNLADGELAINLTDERLYFKNAGGTVKLLAANVTPVANGGTGQTSYTNGQLLIGNTTGNTLTKATLTAGSGISITNGAGSITISNTASVAAATPTALGTVYGLTDPNSGQFRTALGFGAVQSSTSASYSVGIGVLALNAVTSGSFNVGVGWGSFRTITTASNNTGVGHASGTATTSGADNTAVGYQALTSNTTGSNNTALGSGAIFNGTTGSNNTGIGYNALNQIQASSNNTAVGYNALYNGSAAITGSLNTAIGASAMGGNAITSGSNNVAVGYQSLLSNTTGSNNVGIGPNAVRFNTTGGGNIGIGQDALSNASATGISFNVAIGQAAGDALTSGSNNIIIGFGADASTATTSNEVTIGNTDIVSTRLRGMVQLNAAMLEQATVSATAAAGTINFDARTQSVLYYTSNASGNWTLNVRAASGVSLDSVMSTGQSVTLAFLVTNGATAYYQSAFQVDGVSVTPKWQGGTAPTAGNASSIDAYVITIIKTGSATFTALASQTKFA